MKEVLITAAQLIALRIIPRFEEDESIPLDAARRSMTRDELDILIGYKLIGRANKKKWAHDDNGLTIWALTKLANLSVTCVKVSQIHMTRESRH